MASTISLFLLQVFPYGTHAALGPDEENLRRCLSPTKEKPCDPEGFAGSFPNLTDPETGYPIQGCYNLDFVYQPDAPAVNFQCPTENAPIYIDVRVTRHCGHGPDEVCESGSYLRASLVMNVQGAPDSETKFQYGFFNTMTPAWILSSATVLDRFKTICEGLNEGFNDPSLAETDKRYVWNELQRTCVKNPKFICTEDMKLSWIPEVPGGKKAHCEAPKLMCTDPAVQCPGENDHCEGYLFQSKTDEWCFCTGKKTTGSCALRILPSAIYNYRRAVPVECPKPTAAMSAGNVGERQIYIPNPVTKKCEAVCESTGPCNNGFTRRPFPSCKCECDIDCSGSPYLKQHPTFCGCEANVDHPDLAPGAKLATEIPDPNTPSGRNSPVAPSGPVTSGPPPGPTSPTTPASAITPASPTTPASPSTPASPTTPAGPGAPAAPLIPPGPITPSVPSFPVPPNNPNAPATPASILIALLPPNPLAPFMPASPSTPASPTTPASVVTPAGPQNPDTPAFPNQPSSPNRPDSATPANPNTASSPNSVLSVNSTIRPGGFGSPQNPIGPNGPWTPLGPNGPQAPIGPLGPQAPLGPLGPQSPLGPLGPQSPLGPNGPQSPVGPIGPNNPITPTGPLNPVTPGGPISPTPITPVSPLAPPPTITAPSTTTTAPGVCTAQSCTAFSCDTAGFPGWFQCAPPGPGGTIQATDCCDGAGNTLQTHCCDPGGPGPTVTTTSATTTSPACSGGQPSCGISACSSYSYNDGACGAGPGVDVTVACCENFPTQFDSSAQCCNVSGGPVTTSSVATTTTIDTTTTAPTTSFTTTVFTTTSNTTTDITSSSTTSSTTSNTTTSSPSCSAAYPCGSACSSQGYLQGTCGGPGNNLSTACCAGGADSIESCCQTTTSTSSSTSSTTSSTSSSSSSTTTTTTSTTTAPPTTTTSAPAAEVWGPVTFTGCSCASYTSDPMGAGSLRCQVNTFGSNQGAVNCGTITCNIGSTVACGGTSGVCYNGANQADRCYQPAATSTTVLTTSATTSVAGPTCTGCSGPGVPSGCQDGSKCCFQSEFYGNGGRCN